MANTFFPERFKKIKYKKIKIKVVIGGNITWEWSTSDELCFGLIQA